MLKPDTDIQQKPECTTVVANISGRCVWLCL